MLGLALRFAADACGQSFPGGVDCQQHRSYDRCFVIPAHYYRGYPQSAELHNTHQYSSGYLGSVRRRHEPTILVSQRHSQDTISVERLRFAINL
ncbi:hypothetical protein D3C85_1524090 [compost metagenome]